MTTTAVTSVAGLTDVGQVRRINEDTLLINEQLQLYVIADGMGGHGAGDVASQLAVQTLQSCLASEPVRDALANKDISDAQATALVYQCIVGVNERIYKENVNNGHPDGSGMGTTLVGFIVLGNSQRAISFNIGDSRLYEYYNTNLAQLTTDHTMYQEWEITGRVGPAPPRNIIMRAIGLFANVDIDMDILTINKGATYLLCSDGLTDMLNDDQITDTLAQSDDPKALNETIVQMANEHGGKDNISVITMASSH